MPATPSASLIDALAALALGALDPAAGNRIALEGLAAVPRGDGALELGIRKLEAASLRLALPAVVVEIEQLVLRDVVALLRPEGNRLRLVQLQAGAADLSGVRLHGPLAWPAPGTANPPPASGPWRLEPLASAEGTLRAEIVDAHLIFDADVTVPIRHGGIDFNKASVEHVGPDSRMGVSRMGLYVDAPNGRSYLYQFPATPVAGVSYERRGAMLGPWVSDRGKLELQPFAEALLQQHPRTAALCLTEQARLLFDRTAASGDLQLGDGAIAGDGWQLELAGAAEGRNLVRLHSEAVGRGLTLEMAALAARSASWQAAATHLGCETLAATLRLRILREGDALRFAVDLAHLNATGLRAGRAPPAA